MSLSLPAIRKTAAVFASLAALSGATAAAADKALLDVLLSNGAITAEQYEALLRDEAAPETEAERILTTLDSNGFNVKSQDGAYSLKIGTRLHAEASTHSGSLPAGVEPTNGSELRRARLEMKGTFRDDWSWAGEIDFADDRTSVKDFKLGYQTENGTKIFFGHQKQPYSLALEMSSNELPFIERSVDNFLTVPFADRAIGLRVENSGDNWYAAGGLFGESVSPGAVAGDEGWGLSGRFVYSPIIEDDRVLHLGVRALTRAPSTATDAVRIRDETTHLSNLRIVDTGDITNVDRTNAAGVEAAFALGQFSIVGEYNALSTDRDGLDNLDFSAWNVYSTWSITGESRAAAYSMKDGEFKGLKPASEFNPADGMWGAWEVALRYATIDLNDGLFVGGEESVVTSGLNWYLNSNIRLMLEWSRIVDTDDSTALRQAADGLDIFQFRTQYTF